MVEPLDVDADVSFFRALQHADQRLAESSPADLRDGLASYIAGLVRRVPPSGRNAIALEAVNRGVEWDWHNEAAMWGRVGRDIRVNGASGEFGYLVPVLASLAWELRIRIVSPQDVQVIEEGRPASDQAVRPGEIVLFEDSGTFYGTSPTNQQAIRAFPAKVEFSAEGQQEAFEAVAERNVQDFIMGRATRGSGRGRTPARAFLDAPQPASATADDAATLPAPLGETADTAVASGSSMEALSSVAAGRPEAESTFTGWADGLRMWSWRQGGEAAATAAPAQIDWAANHGMTFAGKRDGGDFFDALAEAGRAAGLGETFGGRDQVTRRVAEGRADGPTDEMVADYARAKLGASADGPIDEAVIVQAHSELDSGWHRIFRQINDGGMDAVTEEMLPRITQRSLAVPLHVVDADGRVRSYGGDPGAGVTVAKLPGDQGGWMALVPTREPRLLGAATRPADVAGGWRTSTAEEDTPDLRPLRPGQTGAAYRETLRQNGLWPVEVPRDTDAFFNAVLRAAGGGLRVGQADVNTVAQLRGVLVDEIKEAAGVRLASDERIPEDDAQLWRVVYTTYQAAHRQRHGTPAEDARIERGEMLNDITASISEPGSWPELAEAVAPYFLNRLGLSVRVIHGSGAVDRYGDGRPAYVTPLAGTDDGPRRWAALPKATRRYADGSPLGVSRNTSDPVLVRLGQAYDARKADSGVTAADDPVLTRLEEVRTGWRENGTAVPATVTGGPWTSEGLRAKVGSLNPLNVGPGSSPRGDRTVGAGLGLASGVELIASLFQERGGIRPLAEAAVADQTGTRAGQWSAVPSLRELIRALPSNGAALFVSGGRTWVAVETLQGPELAEFGPQVPAGRVSRYSPADDVAADSPGLALFVGQDGQVVRPGSLGSAVGWEAGDLSAVMVDVPRGASAPDGTLKLSEAQQDWARDNAREFAGLGQGRDSFFHAAISAAGGPLTVNGEEITDPGRLREALAASLSEKAADLGPVLPAAFMFAAENRIIEEFFGNDLEGFDRKAVYEQIARHIRTGAATRFVEPGIREPGHWEEITQLLAPALLAANADVRVKVVERDGRVRAYETTTGDATRDIVLARAGADAGSTVWEAVRPSETPADVRADETIRGVTGTSSGETAVLTERQTYSAQDLGVAPTEKGADSFYSALLQAAGGAVMLSRDRYAATPTELRDGLADLVRERPDLLETLPVPQSGEAWNAEKVIDRIRTEPVGHDIDRPTLFLIGAYLGVTISVLERDGRSSLYAGRKGRSLTVAPTTEEGTSDAHWAALVENRPLRGTPSGQERLFDRPSARKAWSEDTYKVVNPGTRTAEESAWREPSFCAYDADGNKTCVSVTVVRSSMTVVVG